MRRYLAVRVERPRRGFATLVRLRGTSHDTRSFATLRPDQTTADVRFYLIDERRGGRKRTFRPLQTVRITDLDRKEVRGDALTITTRYDGSRTAQIEISERGRVRTRAELSVEPEPRRLVWIAIIPLFLIAAVALWLYLRPESGDGGGVTTQTTEVERSIREESGDGGAGTRPAIEVERTTREESGDGGTGTPSPIDVERTDRGDGGGVTTQTTEVARSARDDGDGGATQIFEDERTTRETVGDGEAIGDGGSQAVSAERLADRRGSEFALRVYFEPNSIELDSAAVDRIAEIVPVLNAGGDRRVAIIGHAAPYGSDIGREDVSRGRAITVREALVRAGWTPDAEVSVEWRGATDPVTRLIHEQHLNRRVEIEFLPDRTE